MSQLVKDKVAGDAHFASAQVYAMRLRYEWCEMMTKGSFEHGCAPAPASYLRVNARVRVVGSEQSRAYIVLSRALPSWTWYCRPVIV